MSSSNCGDVCANVGPGKEKLRPLQQGSHCGLTRAREWLEKTIDGPSLGPFGLF